MVAVGPIPRREYRKDWLWRVDRGDNAVEQSVARELAAGSRSWCYLGLGYGGGVSRESSHGGSQRKHGGTHFAGLERKRRRSVAVIDRRNRRERGQWPGPVHETLSRPRYSFFLSGYGHGRGGVSPAGLACEDRLVPRKEEVLRHEIPETDLARANCLRTVLAAWEAGAIPSSKKVKKIRVYQCWVVTVESCAGDSEVKRNWRRVLNNKISDQN